MVAGEVGAAVEMALLMKAANSFRWTTWVCRPPSPSQLPCLTQFVSLISRGDTSMWGHGCQTVGLST